MINEYAIYDMKDNEQLVYMGTMKEVADYFNRSCESLRASISRKEKIKHRYLIEKVGYIEDDE